MTSYPVQNRELPGAFGACTSRSTSCSHAVIICYLHNVFEALVVAKKFRLSWLLNFWFTFGLALAWWTGFPVLYRVAVADKKSKSSDQHTLEFDTPFCGLASWELLSPFTVEVVNLISSLSTLVVKSYSDTFDPPPPTVCLAELSFSSGCFPCGYKTALVSVLLKKEG